MALTADLAALGVRAAAPAPELCHVWPENWDALALFLACATQWRVAMGGAIGLDYAGVEAVMRMQRVAIGRRAALLTDVQIIEREALAVFSARASDQPMPRSTAHVR
ncbi:MAG: DUF1799 domain-containing protein [Gammaproteobacteria bacterium]|nr:DUF1799 domain-containing protein [Gammaproteobacteria bacterium]